MTDENEQIRWLESVVSLLSDAADLQDVFGDASERLAKLKQEKSNRECIDLGDRGPVSVAVDLPRALTSHEEEILRFVAHGGKEGISMKRFREQFPPIVLDGEEASGSGFLHEIVAMQPHDYCQCVRLTPIGVALVRQMDDGQETWIKYSGADVPRIDHGHGHVAFDGENYGAIAINDPNGGRC